MPADATPPKSPPSVRESRLSFSQDFRATADPSHTEELEPVTRSKLGTPQRSSSEHTSYHQKSLDENYFAKKTQWSNHSKSNGSSKRSSGSHGSLSSRSSISEMFSDRAESVGSYRSRRSGKGALREVGSESGGRNSSFSGLNVGGFSDNDSF